MKEKANNGRSRLRVGLTLFISRRDTVLSAAELSCGPSAAALRGTDPDLSAFSTVDSPAAVAMAFLCGHNNSIKVGKQYCLWNCAAKQTFPQKRPRVPPTIRERIDSCIPYPENFCSNLRKLSPPLNRSKQHRFQRRNFRLQHVTARNSWMNPISVCFAFILTNRDSTNGALRQEVVSMVALRRVVQPKRSQATSIERCELLAKRSMEYPS